jgi:Protein of unknown function (DUF1566)
MRPDIVNREKSSSHPLKSGRFYMGIVKSVDSRGAATVYVSELGSSYDKVVPLNTTNLNRVAVGDVVKCTFSDEFFTELIVLGVSNIKEVPEVSSFAPTISSPVSGQVIKYNGTSWINESEEGFAYKVGDTGPGGGIIFFVDRFDEYTGFTYLEVAPVSTEVQRTWATNVNSNQTTAVSGADSKALGAGYQNTLDIVAQTGNVAATCAAAYCADLTSGGQSDWYLPSISELNMIFSVVSYQLGVGGFSSNNYWSSTENASNLALYQNFSFGAINPNTKSTTYYVRPVRRF